MANLFISYSRQSEAVASTLTNDIVELGHTVWIDQKLSGGQAWWDQILSKVRECDVFVFVLDSAALNSTACIREYSYAADLGKPILPILVAEGVSTNLLPPELSKIQFVDYRKQDRQAVLHLSKTFNSLPHTKPLPDPLPLPPEIPISYLAILKQQIETPSNLSYEEQSKLVFDLKRSLRDPSTTDDARKLTEKFRKRLDLLANIAEEIEELLGSMRKAEVDHQDEQSLGESRRADKDRGKEEKKGSKVKSQYWVIMIGLVIVIGLGFWSFMTQVPQKTITQVPKIPKKTWLEPITGMEFVWVEGGCFEMGCGKWQDKCYYGEMPPHEVCVDSFYIAQYEVTQSQWLAVMNSNPSKFQEGGEYPVESAKWEQVDEFINKINRKNTGIHVRLPTEAEWEFAARSRGKAEIYAGGDNIETLAWYSGNSGSKTHPVGEKAPNGLGLYDMSGNVW